jgi:hypothetical protein
LVEASTAASTAICKRGSQRCTLCVAQVHSNRPLVEGGPESPGNTRSGG